MPADRTGADQVPLPLDQKLGRCAHKAEARRTKHSHIRRRIQYSQPFINPFRFGLKLPFLPERQIDLKYVSLPDIILDRRDRPFKSLARKGAFHAGPFTRIRLRLPVFHVFLPMQPFLFDLAPRLYRKPGPSVTHRLGPFPGGIVSPAQVSICLYVRMDRTKEFLPSMVIDPYLVE